MIKPLERIINKGFRRDMDLLFGDNSKVVISRMDFITSDKTISIHVKLYVTEVEKSMEVYPEGLRILVIDGWRMFCLDSPIHITTSIDVLL